MTDKYLFVEKLEDIDSKCGDCSRANLKLHYVETREKAKDKWVSLTCCEKEFQVYKEIKFELIEGNIQ